MSDRARGMAAVVLSALIWGLAPLVYKRLAHIPPAEVLAHRAVWSFVALGLLLAARGQLSQVRGALATRRLALGTTAAAILISINWGLFVWAIQNGRAAEASLGYYIYPLIAAGLGLAVLHERLDRPKQAALALAGAGVLVLGLGLAAVPWVALCLGLSFAVYGLLKKALPIAAVPGVAAEVLLIAPLAAGYLLWLAWQAQDRGVVDWVLLIVTGPLTIAPLVLFAVGARHISLASAGLILYLNPSMQFLIAIAVFGEPVTQWHAIALPLIWAGLAVFTAAVIRQERSARSAATRSSTTS